MSLQARDGNLRSALRGHIADKAAAAREQYGPSFDDEAVHHLLADRQFVRYPVTLQYDVKSLEPGCVAAVRPLSDGAAHGFLLSVHPMLRDRDDALRLIVARHLVEISYGRVATVEDAEVFGATLLGMSVEAFRRELAQLAHDLLQKTGTCFMKSSGSTETAQETTHGHRRGICPPRTADEPRQRA